MILWQYDISCKCAARFKIPRALWEIEVPPTERCARIPVCYLNLYRLLPSVRMASSGGIHRSRVCSSTSTVLYQHRDGSCLINPLKTVNTRVERKIGHQERWFPEISRVTESILCVSAI